MLGAERTALWRHYDQLTSGHALTDIVVGITFQVHVQATGIPHTETLTRSTLEAIGNRRTDHALVAMHLGDLARDACANGAIAIGQPHLKLTTGAPIDTGTRHFDHLLGGLALVKRRIARLHAELRLIGRHVLAEQQRLQVKILLLACAAW